MPRRERSDYEDENPLSPDVLMGDDDEDYDPDLDDLNNPDVESLSEPPLLGARPRTSNMFGEEAQPFGRATSPKLYAAAAQFPTAVQFRVWRWENGVPVGLGSIDAEATEEDFVRAYFAAMPKAGEGKFQFRMRPIDIRGQELGKEFTINISEHHATLRQLTELKKREEAERMNGGGWSRGPGGDIHVHGGGQGFDQVGASYAEEMGRMFEQAVGSAEEQANMLRDSLEMERERLREEEKARTEERVSMAERASLTTEKMMERLMASDRARSEEQMKSQGQHSDLLMTTLTTVFQQQQSAAREQSERVRESDTVRMQQDREFFERQRQEMESRRLIERDEAERRRSQEREEADHRRRTDAEEWERKRMEERQRLDAEQRRLEENRKFEVEQMRLETQRREAELERRREMEKEEIRLRLERERMELESRREQLREEREKIRLEAEERRSRDLMEFERKMAAEREDRERRERADKERWERERQAAEAKRDEERRDWERRESLRREEMQREGEARRLELQREQDRRREETAMQMKQMETSAQRDREHAERMMETQRMEREAAREAMERREKTEREAREHAERERQRQFDLQKFEMEQSKERDREHAERMLQMSKIQNSGGLSGITDMLGMETPELLQRIFGAAEGGGEEGGGWADAIPKVLGTLAEVGAKAMQARQPPAPSDPGRRRVKKPAAEEQKVAIQTPDGIKMIPMSALAQLQAARATPGIPMTIPAPHRHAAGEDDDDDFEPDLPTAPFRPGQEPAGFSQRLAPQQPQPESGKYPELRAGAQVSTLKRAKEAGMSLAKQRAARRAIRALIPNLQKAGKDEWIGVITEALTREIGIYYYLKAVSVYAALAEAKVAPDVAEKVVAEMKASGMIPEDVPYTEEDFARLQAATEETPGEPEKLVGEPEKLVASPSADPEEDDEPDTGEEAE